MGARIVSMLGIGLEGPYLALDDLDAGTRERYELKGETFTLVKYPERFCVGSYDLMTQEHAPCEKHQELPFDHKDSSCPRCNEITGFNPSFYNGGGITAQQRVYNDTPHIVYLAYFDSDHLKVGITSSLRGIGRLLEQGARSAMILKECASAYEAREWEAKLCATPGIYESLRGSEKYRMLTTQTHDPAEAAQVMARTVREQFSLEPTEPINLDRHYCEDPSILSGHINAPDNPSDTMVAGECVGMVGTTILMRQQGRVFAVALKDYPSHRVDFIPGSIQYEYSAPPEQDSLF
ncbi:MAG: DUF2797 domain-containing protein [Raoultibacter sp.]